MPSPECSNLRIGDPKITYTSSASKDAKWRASGKASCSMGDCPMNRTFEGSDAKPGRARNNRKSAVLEAEEKLCLIRQKPSYFIF